MKKKKVICKSSFFRTLKKKLLSTTLWSVLTMLVWEIIEELLEELFVDLILFTITKALLTIIVVNSGVKVVIKKAIKPFIKNLTYKEGNDKMEKVKAFFKKGGTAIKSALKYLFISNPQSTIATGINAIASYFVGYTLDIYDMFCGINLPELYIGTYNIVPNIVAVIIFTLIEVLGIRHSFETNTTADTRKAQEKIVAQAKAEIKAQAKAEMTAKKQAEAEQKEIEKLADEYEAKLLAEETAKKQEAEKQAKVMALIQKRKQEAQKNNSNK